MDFSLRFKESIGWSRIERFAVGSAFADDSRVSVWTFDGLRFRSTLLLQNANSDIGIVNSISR